MYHPLVMRDIFERQWIHGVMLVVMLAALFNHTYIWVHYYTVELPYIRRIYGVRP